MPMIDPQGHNLKPVIRCKCGELCNIRNHHIHADGRVTESFFHVAPMTNNPCGFHEYLELEDWYGLNMPPGTA
jgi:hypothetical protein